MAQGMKKAVLAAALILISTQALADYLPPASGVIANPGHLPIQMRPLKKALLVMIENGGYKDGLPFEIGSTNITTPTGRFKCGNHTVSVSNPGQMVNEIVNFIRQQGLSNDPCYDVTKVNQRWSAEMETRSLAQFIRSNTDFAIEGMSVAAIQAATTPKYSKVIFLQDSQFNADMALSVLNTYRTQYVFDIHVLAHGSKKTIVGGNSSEGEVLRIKKENFFDVLQAQQAAGKKVVIRAVYQQNCFGSYMIANWRNAGAEVVNGSKETNWMPLAYAKFLADWLAGARFDQAVMSGYNSQIPFIRTAMTFMGNPTAGEEMIRDSLPIFSGDLSIKITGR